MSVFLAGTYRVFRRSIHVGTSRANLRAKAAFIPVRSMASAGSKNGDQRKENRLAKEKSPYLLQHKNNPVDWYPWCDEAFEKARSQDKPIFLSVGYSTCHWCHVMERESFEDGEVAKILNEHFVSIKVDKEERPDVDRVYMTFVQAMTGQGGWPLNVWLTPELKPFVGATYFPPNNQPGRPGFKTVLNHVIKQWSTNKAKLVQQGSIVMDAIKEHTGEMSKGSSSIPHVQCIDKLFTDMCSSFDDEMGGIGGAPKFPQAALFNFLLRYSKFKSDESGQKALGMFIRTLECMQKGGIHDHVGQGFHRYSTDRDWHVPHFEKMLYDESQLAVLYTDGYQASKNETLAETVRDILLYVMRDLSHKLGGFYSAEDADSLPSHKDTEKKEGAFCVWEEDELKTLLEEKIPTKSGDSIPLSTLFIKYYGVKTDGNVKPHQDPHKELRKKNVLIVRESLHEIAKSLDVDESEAKEHLARAREILFEERKTRPAPHLDTKMVTAWNGLMISAYARAAQVLGEDVYLKRAVKAAEFVRKYLHDEKSGKLLRSCYKGDGDEIEQIGTPIFGFVDDYGFLIRGLLDLYEASLDEQWLLWAIRTQDKMDELFLDNDGGGYYQAMAGDASILVRMKEAQDGAEPSANSTSVNNLLRLASFTGDKRYRQGAEKILSAFEMLLSKMPLALPEMVSGFMTYLTPTKQIIIAGDRDADDTKELLRCVHSHFIPHKALMLCDGRTDSFLASKLDVFKSLERKDNKATAYVCENYSCQLPVNSATELQKLLASS